MKKNLVRNNAFREKKKRPLPRRQRPLATFNTSSLIEAEVRNAAENKAPTKTSQTSHAQTLRVITSRAADVSQTNLLVDPRHSPQPEVTRSLEIPVPSTCTTPEAPANDGKPADVFPIIPEKASQGQLPPFCILASSSRAKRWSSQIQAPVLSSPTLLANLGSLPVELLVHILHYLSLDEQLRLAFVSHQLRRAVRHKSLWRQLRAPRHWTLHQVASCLRCLPSDAVQVLLLEQTVSCVCRCSLVRCLKRGASFSSLQHLRLTALSLGSEYEAGKKGMSEGQTRKSKAWQQLLKVFSNVQTIEICDPIMLQCNDVKDLQTVLRPGHLHINLSGAICNCQSLSELQKLVYESAGHLHILRFNLDDSCSMGQLRDLSSAQLSLAPVPRSSVSLAEYTRRVPLTSLQGAFTIEQVIHIILNHCLHLTSFTCQAVRGALPAKSTGYCSTALRQLTLHGCFHDQPDDELSSARLLVDRISELTSFSWNQAPLSPEMLENIGRLTQLQFLLLYPASEYWRFREPTCGPLRLARLTSARLQQCEFWILRSVLHGAAHTRYPLRVLSIEHESVYLPFDMEWLAKDALLPVWAGLLSFRLSLRCCTHECQGMELVRLVQRQQEKCARPQRLAALFLTLDVHVPDFRLVASFQQLQELEVVAYNSCLKPENVRLVAAACTGLRRLTLSLEGSHCQANARACVRELCHFGFLEQVTLCLPRSQVSVYAPRLMQQAARTIQEEMHRCFGSWMQRLAVPEVDRYLCVRVSLLPRVFRPSEQ